MRRSAPGVDLTVSVAPRVPPQPEPGGESAETDTHEACADLGGMEQPEDHEARERCHDHQDVAEA